MSKICVATPAYGDTVYTPYVQSLLRLQRALMRRGDQMQHVSISFAEVSEARNFLLTYWFDKTDASHILFVDADMGFEPQLVFDMLALEKPMVGMIYPRRQVDLARIAELAAKGEPPARAIARAHDFIIRPLKGKTPRRERGFLEVEGCGAGLLLVSRGCIAEMLRKRPLLSDRAAKKNSPLARDLDRLIRAFDPLTVDGARLSEDFSFCHRWHAQCGGEIWARADRAVTHIGPHRFESRYADAGGGQRVELASQPLALHVGGEAGDGALTVKEGEGPKVIRGRLNIPKPVKKAEKGGAKA
ncbi:MAG: hypothetical protein IT539_12780 [Bradyrhizobiaceae bacterium]|nr:hypothetical protein [Bradyrhizobiaceae bacterium]